MTRFPDETAVESVRRRLRAALARADQEFDRGMRAAVTMLEHGATLERIKECLKIGVEYDDTVVVDFSDGIPTPVEPTKTLRAEIAGMQLWQGESAPSVRERPTTKMLAIPNPQK